MKSYCYFAVLMFISVATAEVAVAHDLKGLIVTQRQQQTAAQVSGARLDAQYSAETSDAKATAHAFRIKGVISNAFLWPAHPLSICFNGGSSILRAQITGVMMTAWPLESLTKNMLSYGPTFNRPSSCTSSTNSAADIKVSFLSGPENGGWWSYVGTDSLNYNPSMNFEGFDTTLPADWKSIVAHEMGHALGLQHEHQSPVAPVCKWDLAWPDGYIARKYVWQSEADMDAQFNRLTNYLLSDGAWAYTTTQYDKGSIMHYWFADDAFTDGAEDPCHIQQAAQGPDHLDRYIVAIKYGPPSHTSPTIAQAHALQATLQSPFVQGRALLQQLLRAKLRLLKQTLVSAP